MDESQKHTTEAAKGRDVWEGQSHLETLTEQLLRRIHQLQGRQTQKHVIRHISSFVKHEQSVSELGCQYHRDATKSSCPSARTRDNTNHIRSNCPNNSPIKANATVATALSSAEEKIKLFSPEGVKNLSTSALVNLVKRLENSGHNGDTGKTLPSAVMFQSPEECLLTPDQSLEKLVYNNHHHYQPLSSESHFDQHTVSCSLNENDLDQTRATVGTLKANLRHLETAYDSDATESSSGGESCDELMNDELVFNNRSASNSNFNQSGSNAYVRKNGTHAPTHL